MATKKRKPAKKKAAKKSVASKVKKYLAKSGQRLVHGYETKKRKR